MLLAGWRVTLEQGRLSSFSWHGHVRAYLGMLGMEPAPCRSPRLCHNQLLRVGYVQAGLSCLYTPPSHSWDSDAHGLMTLCQPQKPLCPIPQALGVYPAPAAPCSAAPASASLAAKGDWGWLKLRCLGSMEKG